MLNLCNPKLRWLIFAFTFQTRSPLRNKRRVTTSQTLDFATQADYLAYVQRWFRQNRSEIFKKITDGSGNLTRLADATAAPVIAMTLPLGSASQANANVTYTLSKPLEQGTITWTRTGGTADPGSPRVAQLTGSELTTGLTNQTPANGPAGLVTGTIYTVTIQGVGLSGKASNVVSKTAVTKS